MPVLACCVTTTSPMYGTSAPLLSAVCSTRHIRVGLLREAEDASAIICHGRDEAGLPSAAEGGTGHPLAEASSSALSPESIAHEVARLIAVVTRAVTAYGDDVQALNESAGIALSSAMAGQLLLPPAPPFAAAAPLPVQTTIVDDLTEYGALVIRPYPSPPPPPAPAPECTPQMLHFSYSLPLMHEPCFLTPFQSSALLSNSRFLAHICRDGSTWD